ncbi:retrovirus-related pol polyprotein LINE-1 [Tanacetum coccineum]
MYECFMPGRSTTEAIHLLRSLMEKYRERQRDLHMTFLDLEKAYDCIPRELVWRTLIDKGAPRTYLRVLRDMYEGAKTRVRSVGDTEFFRVEVGTRLSTKRWRLVSETGSFNQRSLSDISLGSVFHTSGRVDDDVAHRIRAECWPITKAQENRVEVAELRMLRWTCGKSTVDMIPNGVFRAELEVDSIIDKMREGRLRWFGHLKRRPQTAPVRRVEALLVDGSRRRGRPKLRWEDRLKQDMKELRLSEDMTSDRNAWRDRIRTSR